MSEYQRAAKAVQTAIEFNPNKTALEPKHMRVGIDMSKADMSGLVNLLINKGVISLEEYEQAITQSANMEATRHRIALADQLGMDPDKITLL
jgi:hypothetical protein